MNVTIWILITSILINIYLILRLIFTQGILEVDNSNFDKPRWLFLLTMNSDKILKYHRIVLKVKDVTEIVKQNESKQKEEKE